MRHVLWVGCSPPPELLRIQKEIEIGARAIALPAERRDFHPHLALARIEGRSDHRLADYLAAFSGFETTPVTAERIVLYESLRAREGATYTEQKMIQLSDGIYFFLLAFETKDGTMISSKKAVASAQGKKFVVLTDLRRLYVS